VSNDGLREVARRQRPLFFREYRQDDATLLLLAEVQSGIERG
jgi:hypothetical protein